MLYKAIEPDDGAMAIFAAVHLLRWEREWGEPKLLFVEAEPADLLKDERVKALLKAADFAQRTMNDYGNATNWPPDMPMEYATAINKLRDAVVFWKEAPDGAGS